MMRGLKKIVIVLTMSLVVLMGTSVVSLAAEDVFVMDGCTANTITLHWDVANVNSSCTGWYIKDYDDNIVWETNNPSARSAKIAGLSKGYATSLWLYYKYTGEYDDEIYNHFIDYTYANTIPESISKSKFGLASLSKKKISVQVEIPEYASGMQIKLYNNNTGKLKTTKKFYSLSDDIKIASCVPYKYRVRAYYKNDSNGKTYYGSYSSYKYFITTNSELSASSKYKGCKIKLKGMKNVKYKVYVSTSYSKRGTLTKTVKPKAGKYTTYKIDKIGKSKMKKNKTYYVTVQPLIKNGGKYHKSEIFGNTSFTCRK